MRVTNIEIGDQEADFINRQVAKGRFGSTSEAVRAALRLLEEQELKIERLRQALEEGEASGPPEPFDIEEYLAEKRHAPS
jgi:antitoxin ParD1/3/4